MSAVRQRWVERLARYHQSGQTVAVFCHTEAISVSNFYLWKRKLAVTDRPAPLIPIQLTATPPAESLELLLPSGTRLRLPADYSPHHLAILLTALETRPC